MDTNHWSIKIEPNMGVKGRSCENRNENTKHSSILKKPNLDVKSQSWDNTLNKKFHTGIKMNEITIIT